MICIGFGTISIIMNAILKVIPEDKCLTYGNKELDPTKNNGGIMSIRRSESTV